MPGSQRNKSNSVHSKLRKLGLLDSRASSKTSHFTFELFFPRPPYRGAQYRAARGKDGLYNFVGLVLGHGGATVQRIQKASGAKIEVRDSAGNLNGAHPSSHGDPTLHAWVAATSRQRLDKAVTLLLEVLQPTNTRLKEVAVASGGSVVLDPVIPRDWPVAVEEEAAAAADADSTTQAAAALPPPPPATNAWATNRLVLKTQADGRHMSPVSSLARSQGAAAVLESNSSSDAEADPEGAGEAEAAAPLTPEKVEVPLPPPPPPPPPRTHAASDVPTPAIVPNIITTTPATPPGPPPLLANASPLSPQNHLSRTQAPPLQHHQMATVWAKGLHHTDSTESPPTPSALAQPGRLASGLSGTASMASSALSWSLWEGSSGSSFYEQLQAAASEGFPSGDLTAARSAAPQPLAHASTSFAPQYMLPVSSGPVPAPFPGLGNPGIGLSPGFKPAAPAFAAHSATDAEHEMQQLLAAVASMATLDS